MNPDFYENLFDDCYEADNCKSVLDLCALVNKMVSTIQYLELQCIGLRYELSKYLDPEHKECLRSDILSALGDRFTDEPGYELFKELYYKGGDPLEFKEWNNEINKTRHGYGDIFF